MIRFTILGSLDLRSSKGTVVSTLLVQPKRLALLAYLCTASGDLHRRDTLLGLLWAESDQEHARTSLRKAVHLLRRMLGPDVVGSRGDDEIGVNRDAIWCDARAFDEAIAAGRLEDAMRLYRGAFLQGFFLPGAGQFERWVEGERARLQQAAAGAAQGVATRHEANGDLTTAVTWARRAVELAETDERQVRRLIALLDRVGDRTGAVAAYQAFARRVGSEYDLEPSAQTKALVEGVRTRVGSAALATDKGEEPPPVSYERTGRGRALLVSALVVGLALAVGSRASRPQPGTPQPSPLRRGGNPVVAVLPFEYSSAIGGDRYFADGLQQEVISRLGVMAKLTVIERRSVRGVDPHASARAVGDQLGAAFVLRCRLTRDSARIRLTATLIEAHTEDEVWSQSYDRDPSVSALIAIQTDIARKVAEALQVKIGSVERGRGSDRPTENAVAYNLFLHATQLPTGSAVGSNRADAAANIAAAELLHEAIVLDPEFAAGVAELANVYWARAYVLGDSAGWTDSAIALAHRAIALDPELPSAYRPLGLSYVDQGRLTEAEGIYGTILELSPNDGDALLVLGWLAFLRGRIADAERFWLDARAVDPMNVLVHFDLGLVERLFGDEARAEAWDEAARAARGNPGPQVGRLLREGKRREAVDAAEQFLQTHPRSFPALQQAAEAAVGAGEYERARRHFEELERLGPGDWDYWGLTYRTAFAHVLLELGEPERGGALLTRTLHDARRRLDAGDERPGIRREIAAIYAARGDSGQAYEWLGRAIDSGWRLEALHPSPHFERLRGEVRFRALVGRIDADIRRARSRQ
jgi:DNA-binding SARP family transcriptional activator/TolB-like protein